MNKDLLNKLLIFAAGSVIGSAVTFVVMKRKYESYEWEEEYIEEQEEEPQEKEEEPVEEKAGKLMNEGFREGLKSVKRENMVQYNKILKDNEYSSGEEKKEAKDVEKPYMITVDDYAELDNYNTESLYYFEDGVLTDESENIIDDVEDIVGEEALAKFDEEEVDSVYVRNDARKTDYEILRDMGNYYDKYPREDE